MMIKKFNYRNPIARKLHEDRAFRLKVRSDKRVPHVEEVNVREATIMVEENYDDEQDDDVYWCRA